MKFFRTMTKTKLNAILKDNVIQSVIKKKVRYHSITQSQ